MDRYRPDDAAFDDKSSRSRDRSRDDRSSFRDGRHVTRDSHPYDRRDLDRRDHDRRDLDRRDYERRDLDRRDYDRRDLDRRDYDRRDLDRRNVDRRDAPRQGFDRRDYDRRDFDGRDFRRDFGRRDHQLHSDDRDARARYELPCDTSDPSPSHPTALEDGEIAAPSPLATATVDVLDEDEEDEETRQQREEQERERRRQQRNAILAKFSTPSSALATVTASTVPAATPPVATASATAAPSPAASAHAHSNGQQLVPTATDNATDNATSNEDDFDMFSTAPLPESMTARTAAAATAAPQRVPHEGAGAGASSQLSLVGVAHAPVTTGAAGEMVDSWDDHEGYYKYRLGDVLGENGRFRVCGFQGSGVFSTVLRVKDQTNAGGSSDEEFVVKVIRNNETMYKAGMKEVEFLSLLRLNDPDGRRHCVRLVSNFVHRGHLCLVFEPMHMDLRKVMKKFGMVGLSMPAVRAYAQQLVIALRHMKKCGILHGDIKPDNILVNANMNVVKVCDFGSASKLSECEITPYLVSRFYRAPEVMLGLPYAEPVDLWSVGCVLYELFTGKILFSGGSNNEMLLKMMQVKGAFPVKMVKRAMFGAQHFDVDTHQFLHRKIDKASGCEYTQPLTFTAPTHDLYAMLKQHGGDGEDDEGGEEGGKRLRHLADFISQCLTLDPQRRPSVEELMKHPFIVSEQKKEKAVAAAAPVAAGATRSTSTARAVMAATASIRGGRGGLVTAGRR